MCKISDQIKLCSCEVEDVDALKHYWVLSKPNNSDMHILGELILPVELDPEIEQFNMETLVELLNSGTCFDVDLNLQEADVLVLHFTCKDEYLAYGFLFRNSRWESFEHDPFGNGLEEVNVGKIVKPFLSKNG